MAAPKQPALRFDDVFAPRQVLVEGRIGNSSVNYSLATAAAFFGSPGFQAWLSEYLRANPKVELSERNAAVARALGELVTEDLKRRGPFYAKDPLRSPVPYLKANAPAENLAVIQRVIENVRGQLEANALTHENARQRP